VSSEARHRHQVVDQSTEDHPGAQLVTVRCFCGAQRGVDYERYPFHLQQHDPEDFGLGGERHV